jgi:hypothetical protein
MENNKFLARVDEFDPNDYIRANVVSFFYDRDSGLFEVSKTKDEGDFFLVYLVNNHDGGAECVDIMKSYDEAKQLVDKLEAWIDENDWDRLIADDGWTQ